MGKWQMVTDPPEKVRKLIVGDANDVSQAIGKCSLVFRRLKWKRKK